MPSDSSRVFFFFFFFFLLSRTFISHVASLREHRKFAAFVACCDFVLLSLIVPLRYLKFFVDVVVEVVVVVVVVVLVAVVLVVAIEEVVEVEEESFIITS